MKNAVPLFVYLSIIQQSMPNQNQTDLLRSPPHQWHRRTNQTQFRVAHGVEVTDMVKEHYDHLVQIFVVLGTTINGIQQNITGDIPKLKIVPTSCTGMKVTHRQLMGTENENSGMADYVLTAGHCVNRDQEDDVSSLKKMKIVHNPRHIYVVSGIERVPYPLLSWHSSTRSYKLNFRKLTQRGRVLNGDEAANLISSVSYVAYRYPEEKGCYRRENAKIRYSDYHDIAILKLDKQLQTPIVPLQFDEDIKPEQSECRFAGWGVNHLPMIGQVDSAYRGILNQVLPGATELLTESECNKTAVARISRTWDTEDRLDAMLFNNAKQETTVCTRHKHGSMPCYGDSGGPLMCKYIGTDGKFGREMIVGVLAAGEREVLEKIASCFGSKLKPVTHDCDDQMTTNSDEHQYYQRLSVPAIREFVQYCPDIISNPANYNEMWDLEVQCSAMPMKPMNAEYKGVWLSSARRSQGSGRGAMTSSSTLFALGSYSAVLFGVLLYM